MKLTTVLVVLILIQTSVSYLDIFRESQRVLQVNLIRWINRINRYIDKYVLREDQTYWKVSEEAASEYDFVIVGSGSSGAVIANRLSEIKKWKVLLLEAGVPEDQLIDIPLIAAALQGSNYDWGYKIQKQTNACNGMDGNSIPWPRGKALGGSSVLNYMMYCRGSKCDFEEWAANGNTGWSYAEVLPYFIKSEKANLTHIDPRYHGTNGYLGISESYQSCLVPTFLKGGKEIGLDRIDYNAPTKAFGLSPMQSTTWNGRRNSVATAFLRTVTARNNLDILTKAFVTKILFKDNNEAYGVEYEKDGKTHTVKARKEVIVSAGVINSPQLLMLSGIGPKKHLSKLGIPCRKDLPVGRNFQDHLTFYGVIYKIFFDIDQTPLKLIASLPSYFLFGGGPFTTLGGVEGVGYIKTNESKVKVDQPDIEMMFLRGSLGVDFGAWIKVMQRLKDEVYDSIYKPLEMGYQWTIAPVLMHPKSVGWVELNTTDPHDHPLIDPQYFTDKENRDIKTMIAGIRVIQKLGRTKAFKRKGARLSRLPVHGCTEMEFDSDKYWECALRTLATTLYHGIGTAKMGPEGDPTAVVDNRLRVYGIKKLRVADASIMPSQSSGHINAVAIMIGEKVSDFIKEDWGAL